jgi:N-ethylmaleimide reductase
MAFVISDGVGRRVPASPPVALDSEGIAGTIADYVNAARRAIEAGFDGVEVHGANGYLLHQFLASNVNQRTDGYGGSAAKRARMLVEVTEAVAGAVDPDRVGVRVSPLFRGNGIADEDPVETFHTVAALLEPMELAYLHVADTSVMAPGVGERMAEVLAAVGDAFTGPVVLNGAYDALRARADIAAGRGTAVAFGRAFLANPDLPARLFADAPLNSPDPGTFYGGAAAGYTDYPPLGS